MLEVYTNVIFTHSSNDKAFIKNVLKEFTGVLRRNKNAEKLEIPYIEQVSLDVIDNIKNGKKNHQSLRILKKILMNYEGNKDKLMKIIEENQ